ncbi:hypothetical protein CFIMG_008643RA00001 [Ceratocystis fimbriata CBS 114723]|uniref:Uncharacterized protein n=1 Tax=Ceratocystis fimbriata CBS 114723 TaxID=1035309 RepID=A0A2C5XI38_9PEZI|nr:hypothetical protein CFIMG_008643RA00001 [Ceratocystis fimbriata CBS 114723]
MADIDYKTQGASHGSLGRQNKPETRTGTED